MLICIEFAIFLCQREAESYSWIQLVPCHLQSPDRKQTMGKGNKSLAERRMIVVFLVVFLHSKAGFVINPTQHLPEKCYGWVGLINTVVVVWGWCIPEAVVPCNLCFC